MDSLKFNDYTCLECGTRLVKMQGKFGEFYACPKWKQDGTGCRGHTFNLNSHSWKVASKTQPRVMYLVRFENGKLYCDCPASSFKKIECRHKKAIKEKYGINESTGKEMEETFYQMKKAGHFKDFSTFEEWQRRGEK